MESLEHIGVSEIGELKEGLDHRTVFGVFKFVTDFLERSLDFGDLDHRGGTGVKTSKKFNALIDSIDGHVSFLDISNVLGMGSSSLSGSSIHLVKGVNDKLLISGNLVLKGSFEWVKDVLKGGGSGSNIRFSMSNSLSDGSFPFVVLSQLDVIVLGVDVNLELVVSQEVLESLDQVSNW